jgi:hypothetical protein
MAEGLAEDDGPGLARPETRALCVKTPSAPTRRPRYTFAGARRRRLPGRCPLRTSPAGRVCPVPSFDEATCCRCPWTGATSLPPAYGGVVAVFTLHGPSRFRMWTTGQEFDEWGNRPASAGTAARRRLACTRKPGPLHEVDPPVRVNRMTMDLPSRPRRLHRLLRSRPHTRAWGAGAVESSSRNTTDLRRLCRTAVQDNSPTFHPAAPNGT